jgi:methenyltetrahydromethanopterin cyclohydrolase
MKTLSDFDKEVLSIMQTEIHGAIKARMSAYGSPLTPIIDDAFKVHGETIRKMLYDSLGEVLLTADFKESIKQAFHHKVARSLVDGMSGSVDKAINTFKQDPTIKAKMVLAIESVIKEVSK